MNNVEMEQEIFEQEIKVEREMTINGTTDYEMLMNKPQIEGIELVGNKTLEELGIIPYDDTEIKEQISILETNKADRTEIPKSIEDLTDGEELKEKVNTNSQDISNLDTEVENLTTNINEIVKDIEDLETKKADKTEIPVLDETTSTTSENGVKNKAITSYVNSTAQSLGKSIGDLGTSLGQSINSLSSQMNSMGNTLQQNIVNGDNGVYNASKAYTDSAIKGVSQFNYEVVEVLPETGVKGTIYLISNGTEGTNIYDEYIWVENKYEKIGTTEADLSNYYDKTTIDGMMDNKADKTDIPIVDETLSATSNNAVKNSSIYAGIQTAKSEAISTADTNANAMIGSAVSSMTQAIGAAYNSAKKYTDDQLAAYEETDPTVPSYVKAITEEDIAKWNEGGSGPVKELADGIVWYNIEDMECGLYYVKPLTGFLTNNTRVYLQTGTEGYGMAYVGLKNGIKVLYLKANDFSAFNFPTYGNVYSLNYNDEAYITSNRTYCGVVRGQPINNLTSTDIVTPLSAAQGKALNDAKQDKLTAGEGITIENNVISSTGGGGSSYTAGENITIEDNIISAKVGMKEIEYSKNIDDLEDMNSLPIKDNDTSFYELVNVGMYYITIHNEFSEELIEQGYQNFDNTYELKIGTNKDYCSFKDGSVSYSYSRGYDGETGEPENYFTYSGTEQNITSYTNENEELNSYANYEINFSISDSSDNFTIPLEQVINSEITSRIFTATRYVEQYDEEGNPIGGKNLKYVGNFADTEDEANHYLYLSTLDTIIVMELNNEAQQYEITRTIDLKQQGGGGSEPIYIDYINTDIGTSTSTALLVGDLEVGTYIYKYAEEKNRFYMKIPNSSGSTTSYNISSSSLYTSGWQIVNLQILRKIDKDLEVGEIFAKIELGYGTGYASILLYKKSTTAFAYMPVVDMVDWEEDVDELFERVEALEGSIGNINTILATLTTVEEA